MGQAVKRLCSEEQTADGAQVSLEVGSGTWEVSFIPAFQAFDSPMLLYNSNVTAARGLHCKFPLSSSSIQLPGAARCSYSDQTSRSCRYFQRRTLKRCHLYCRQTFHLSGIELTARRLLAMSCTAAAYLRRAGSALQARYKLLHLPHCAFNLTSSGWTMEAKA